MTALMTLDFEASCLPKHGRSFPIEVAVSDLTGRTRAWLIRPHAAWRNWDWTAEAESLHGIGRDQLEREGLPAQVVLWELAATVGEAEVVADSDLDAQWLNTLAAAAQTDPPFQLGHIATVLNMWDTTPERAADAMRVADGLVPQRHRAGSDARWLALVLAGLEPNRQNNARAKEPMFARRRVAA